MMPEGEGGRTRDRQRDSFFMFLKLEITFELRVFSTPAAGLPGARAVRGPSIPTEEKIERSTVSQPGTRKPALEKF